MSQVSKQPHSYQKALLYRIVFDEKAVRYLIAFLFGFFVLHPTVPVFAAEEEVAESAESEVVEEAVPESEPEEIAEPESNDEVTDDEEMEDTDESVVEESPDSAAETDELVPEEVTEVDEGIAESVTEDEDADQGSTEVDDEVGEEVDVVTEEADEVATSTTSEVEPDADTATTTAGTATSSPETGEISGGSNTNDESSSGEIIETATSTATTTEVTEESAATPVEGGATDSDVDEVGSEDGDEEVETEAASSTADVVGENAASTSEAVTPVVVHNDDSNDPLHFNPQDCVAVGDGSFYCEKQAGELPTYEDDEIYVATDADGDKEIFVRLRGEEMQLTHNLVDDAAPKFDPRGGYMAWHRLVNDRYQIILYNLETKEETQLTGGPHNNMQPDIFGGNLVWQTWDGNDWEVTYYNGNEAKLLTSNELPDLSPHLNDTYAIWNTVHEDHEKAVVVHDLATGQVELIEDSDDVMVKNPRLILMYEAEFGNGDIVTRGFDIETGRIIPLTASPEELPDELPEPDQTGETRALISSKTNARENEDTSDIDIVTKPAPATSTPEADPILDLTKASTTPAVSSSTPPTDLVVTEFTSEGVASTTEESAAASSSPVSHIEDVVIPAASSTETD